MPEDTWSMLQSERAGLVNYLRTLSPEDWEKPSPCAGWQVKHVVAHVVAGARSTPPRFVGGMISAGFSFNKMSETGIAKEIGRSPERLINELDGLKATRTIPGMAMVGEALVHGEDVRRAVGSPPGEHPMDHVRAVAGIYKKAGPPIRAKKRVAGLMFRATDTDWVTGEGPVVSGPLLSLVLAFSGRRAALGDLSGEGLAAFSERM